jgi:PAS domain S-box-containing protein
MSGCDCSQCRIDELLKIRESLKEAQRIAHIGSWDWDILNDKLFWSDESYRLLGLEPSSAAVRTGMHLELMAPDERERVSRARDDALKNHETYDVTYRIEALDGKTKYIHSLGYARYDEAGRPVYMSGTMQDVTDRKRAEEEAAKRMEADARLKVMTEFFTNVSHELKTPLSLILMQMDSMRMHMGDEQRMQNLLSDATLNAYRLTRLVNNLLDIVRMDSGFMRINLKRRDIVNELRTICDSVAGFAAAKSVALEFKSDAVEKQMDLDREKLDRIVLNLLSNAIKHTPEHGRIAVELKDMGDKVLIFVRDTGTGIPADKLNTIFDRFVQVNNRMSRQAEGCGIGLALVKSMTELHGGRVWAESELGKGSEFAVELPVTVSGSQPRPEVIEGFNLNKKVLMELSDLYIRTGS